MSKTPRDAVQKTKVRRGKTKEKTGRVVKKRPPRKVLKLEGKWTIKLSEGSYDLYNGKKLEGYYSQLGAAVGAYIRARAEELLPQIAELKDWMKAMETSLQEVRDKLGMIKEVNQAKGLVSQE